MQRYWLRVEAQNLASFIMDTQDLSTARGGSLTLLNIVEEIGSRCARNSEIDGFLAITTGASIGIWQFDAETREVAEAVARRVRFDLAYRSEEDRGSPFVPAAHATFRVVVIPTSSSGTTKTDVASFFADQEALDALVRRRQLSAAGLVYPADERRQRAMSLRDAATAASVVDEADVCSIDRVRPVARHEAQIRGASTSRSVADRRRYGVNEKQRFYARELFEREDATSAERRSDTDSARLRALVAVEDAFAFQLPSISESELPALVRGESLRRSLKGKVAVLYMDGNRFGKLQRRFIEEALHGDDASQNDVDQDADRQFIEKATGGNRAVERQRRFDSLVKGNRRKLLFEILRHLLRGPLPGMGQPCKDEEVVRRSPERKGDGAGKDVIRFETLLWGGDEMMFVMPARFGWDIAELICRETADWSLGLPADEDCLHHAIGLVFCHHDAPISRIQSLARKLADHAKDMTVSVFGGPSEKGAGRNATFVMPVVLESFDHIGGDLSSYLDKRSPPSLKIAGLDETAAAAQAAQRSRFAALSLDEIVFLRRFAEAASGQTTDLTPISRRRLRAIARACHAGWSTGRFSVEQLIKESGAGWLKGAADIPGVVELAAKINAFGRERAFMMLEDHWDYLLPVIAADADEEAGA